MTFMPFVGRAQELRSFQDSCVLIAEAPFGAAAGRRYENLHGIEAIGKTALAVEFEQRVKGSDVVAAILVSLDELDEIDLFDALAMLRGRLGSAAPDIECPRFEAAYSLYIAQFRPREFRSKRWAIGPVDPEEMFKKSIEGGGKKALDEIVAYLPSAFVTGGVASGGAAAAGGAALAAAMTAAFVGAAVSTGAYLTVLLAKHYAWGARQKAQEDAVLASSARLQDLCKASRPKAADFRRELPHLLAEDLNAALEADRPGLPKVLALLFDPVDALDDHNDLQAAPFAEGLHRLMAELKHGYILSFSRKPPSSWEAGFEGVANQAPLRAVYQSQYAEVCGLSEQEVVSALTEHAKMLKLKRGEPKAVAAALERVPGRDTISPATLKAYWHSRLLP